MRIEHIIQEAEDNIMIKQIDPSDIATVQEFCELVNAGGQLSWKLTPGRLLGKIGSGGVLVGAFDDDRIVGTGGIKEKSHHQYSVSEIGYLYVDEDYRGIKAPTGIFNNLARMESYYDVLYATTIKTNKKINSLLARSSKAELIDEVQSPYSSNIINIWLVGNSYVDDVDAVIKDTL